MANGERSRDPASQGWHLDRRVPAALILAILGQTAAAFIWVGTLDQRVANLEERVAASANEAERIARLEEIVRPLPGYLRRIEDKLDRVIERRPEQQY